MDLVPDRMRVVHHPDHLGYSTRERDGEKARIDPPILRNLNVAKSGSAPVEPLFSLQLHPIGDNSCLDFL